MKEKPNPIKRAVYSVSELRRMLGLSKQEIYDAAINGDFPCLKIGKILIFPRAPIDQILEKAGYEVPIECKPPDFSKENIQCLNCRDWFLPTRSDAQYCSKRCQMKAHRDRQRKQKENDSS